MQRFVNGQISIESKLFSIISLNNFGVVHGVASCCPSGDPSKTQIFLFSLSTNIAFTPDSRVDIINNLYTFPIWLCFEKYKSSFSGKIVCLFPFAPKYTTFRSFFVIA